MSEAERTAGTWALTTGFQALTEINRGRRRKQEKGKGPPCKYFLEGRETHEGFLGKYMWWNRLNPLMVGICHPDQ